MTLQSPLDGKATAPLSSAEQNQGLRALRGIAALLVFLQHLFWQANLVQPGPVETLYSLNFGGIGVLIFFGLSAFLISGKAKDPPGRFIIDRARRILPGLWTALLLAATLDYMRIGQSGLTWQVFLLLPFGDLPAVTVPYWTLYYEALLYILIFLFARISPRVVGPMLLVWAVIAWIWQDRPYGNGHYLFPTWYHLLFPIFAGFFAMGILVSWRTAWPVADTRRRITAALNFGCAMLCFGMPLLAKFPLAHTVLYVYPYHWLPELLRPDLVFFYLLFGVGFALRAASLWRADGPIGRVMRIFGDFSYGIYLIHITVMFLGGWLIARAGLTVSYEAAALLLFAFALPLSMLFGWWEFRAQQWLKALLRRGRSTPLRTAGAEMAIRPGE